MKKILILIIAILAINLASASPVLYFSDLTSGPNNGGQDNKGAFVTIWGKNFGASRGTSYVSIGGGQADSYPIWTDTKISFQLGANAQIGNIIVHTSDGDSNVLPFTVRSGNIYFVDANSPNNPGSGTYVDPWRSPASYVATLASGIDGATCYFRAGTYNGRYGVTFWRAQFALGASHFGSAGNYNAFVGYPGETPHFYANHQDVGGGDTMDYNFRVFDSGDEYLLISQLSLYSYELPLGFGEYARLVSNKCEGQKIFTNAGQIMINGHSQVYGNEIFGCISGHKTDHAIYVLEGTDADVGWNWIHDMDIDNGPQMQCHHDNAQANGWVWTNTKVHDNLFDCSAHPSRAFLVTETHSSSTIYFYNNIIIGSKYYQGWESIGAGSASVYFYNNILYDVGNSICYPVYIGANTVHVEIKNNIIYANPAADGYMYVENGAPTPINENNCWYGIGAFSSHHVGDGGTNNNAVEADPKFISTLDFHLQSNSPAIDAGTNSVSSIVKTDFDGNSRPQGSAFDIGAYEYVSSLPMHPADTNQNNLIEMKELIAFIGLWKQGSANVNDVMTALDRWFRGS